MAISTYFIYGYMFANPFIPEESRCWFQFSGEEYLINDEVHVCDPRHWADRNGADISRYFIWEYSITLKTGSCHNGKFVITEWGHRRLSERQPAVLLVTAGIMMTLGFRCTHEDAQKQMNADECIKSGGVTWVSGAEWWGWWWWYWWLGVGWAAGGGGGELVCWCHQWCWHGVGGREGMMNSVGCGFRLVPENLCLYIRLDETIWKKTFYAIGFPIMFPLQSCCLRKDHLDDALFV